mmetsp:Transcript_54617/g.91003  ORF Transcript_54617/g.91003 Transcript_54617/m.91003 type:complete len:275 (-) Transcript_54617:268-1092(-)
MDTQNAGPGLLVWLGELNLTVKTTTTQQCRVQDVNSVGGRNHFDVQIFGETVHLIEQLQHCSLRLTVSTFVAVKSTGSDGVQFVNEDDGRLLLLCKLEGIANNLRTVTDVHLHKLWPGQLQKASLRLSSTCSCEQCFAGPWWTIQQNPLWRLNANRFIARAMSDGKHHSLHHFLDLFVQTSNVTIFFFRFLFHFHRLGARVILIRQSVKDKITILIHPHQIIGLQLVCGDQTYNWVEDGFARGGFDDHGFAHPVRIEVDVASVLLLFVIFILVQ